MKTAERKNKRDEAEEPRERPKRTDDDGETETEEYADRRRVRVATKMPRRSTATRDEGDLLMRIHNGLHEIEEWRRLAHYYDGEIERLGAETRRMIGEMQDALKAA